MVTHQDYSDRLSEYLDGELDASERSAMAAHIDTCATCRADLTDLRAVVRRAAVLPDAAPSQDLWTGIHDRITPGERRRRQLAGRQFVFTLPQLIAASLALMIASGAIVWLARAGGPQMDFPPVAGETLAPAHAPDAAVDEAVRELRERFDAGREKLDPRTVAALEGNLRTIDAAIEQCRAALRTDAAHPYLTRCLAEKRRWKLDLLRRAAALVDSQP